MAEIDTSIDIFEKAPASCGIAGVHWQDFTPTNGIQSQGPIEFQVNSTLHYMDLKRSYLYVKARILKSGKPIEVGDEVTPANLFLHTLFK
jgi:hypothetical protein